jgi:tetratricopeptide (TPR) repeat protein
MKRHPDPETLRRFVNGELPVEELRRTDCHLATCSECRDRADEAASQIAVRLLEETLLSAGYDEAFERAASRAARTLAGLMEEARSAEDLLTDLLWEPGSVRRRRIRDEERFHTFELSQLFRLRSRDAWFTDPAMALQMADLAVEVARHLDAGRYGMNFVEGARALAWGYLSNAFRLNSDLWRAEAALMQSWLHHAQAGQDTFTETEILSFAASLRKTQGLYDEAIQFADRAIAIYREVCDSHLEGLALIKKGVILGDQGRHQEAIPVLRAGLARIDASEDPRFLLDGKHNMIRSLALGGAPDEAVKLLDQTRPVYEELGYQVNLIRLDWLEGQIARDLGRPAEAEAAFGRAHEFFLAYKNGIDAFLTSMDLAEVFFERSRFQQAKKILGQAIPLGEALGLRSKVLPARLLYERAARG